MRGHFRLCSAIALVLLLPQALSANPTVTATVGSPGAGSSNFNGLITNDLQGQRAGTVYIMVTPTKGAAGQGQYTTAGPLQGQKNQWTCSGSVTSLPTGTYTVQVLASITDGTNTSYWAAPAATQAVK
jgi:hypothetical protein